MKLIIGILQNTPLWVYFIFGYILFVGLKASKPRIVEVKNLFIAPIIFTGLTFHTLANRTTHHPLYLIIWFSILSLSIFLGMFHINQLNIEFDSLNGTLSISGSYFTLILFLLIFLSKYYYGVISAINPQFAHEPKVLIFILVISAFSTGTMWGRLIGYLKAIAK